jgi:hypothetical protein
MNVLEPDQNPQPPILFFVHVPKSGGTSFGRILRMNEAGTGTMALGNVFKGGTGGVKKKVDLERTARRVELAGPRLITGHVPISLRDYLHRDVRCCTILRDPVDRTISHYFQVARNTQRQLRRKDGLAPFPEGVTVDDAVTGGYLLDNLHTRMLSGAEDPFRPVDDDMLERAKRALAEELVVFGLLERFDESVVLAKHRLGLRAILTPTLRVDGERPRGDDVPKEMRRDAERWNRYDLELYRYAEELFDAAPERTDLEFCVDLAALAAAQGRDGDALQPAPAGYGGDERSWQLLVRTAATAIRQARDLAEVSSVAHEVMQRGEAAIHRYEAPVAAHGEARLQGTAGRDVIDMLLSLRARPGEEGRPPPGPRAGTRRKPERARKQRRQAPPGEPLGPSGDGERGT